MLAQVRYQRSKIWLSKILPRTFMLFWSFALDQDAGGAGRDPWAHAQRIDLDAPLMARAHEAAEFRLFKR